MVGFIKARASGSARRAVAGAVGWLALAAWGTMAGGQDWKPEPVDPKGHSADVVAVATFGDTLATASSDGTAKVWNLSDDRLTHRVDLLGHEGKVLAVALSPDGSVVATGGADRTVRLWDSTRGTPLATLKGHSGGVETLAFSPDGKILASAGLDTVIRFWNVAEKRLARTLKGHEQGVRGLAFSSDGKLIASAGRDQLVKLWDTVEGSEKATLGHHDAPAWCVAFAPDGKTVASGGLDKMIRLWRVGAAAPPVAGNPIRPVIRLGEVQVQDAAVPQPQEPPPAPGGLGGALVIAQELATQPQPQENEVQSWKVGGDVMALAFGPDNHNIAAALCDLKASRTTPGSVVFLQGQDPDPRPQQFRVLLPGPSIRGPLGPILGLAFAREGKIIATVGGDGSVRTWDPTTAKPVAASFRRGLPEAIEARVMTHLDPVEALAVTPDGKLVATASESAGVSLWDATNRTLIGRLRDPSGPVRTLAISPDGKLLAIGGDGKVVSLRDMDTGGPIDILKGHLGAITTLAFSPNGKTLASGSKDATVTLWDVAKKAEIANLARHTSAVTTLAFSADGTMLATAGARLLGQALGAACGPIRCQPRRPQGRRGCSGLRAGRQYPGLGRPRRECPLLGRRPRGPSGDRSRPPPARSARWRSPPTARRWSVAVTTGRSAAGT